MKLNCKMVPQYDLGLKGRGRSSSGRVGSSHRNLEVRFRSEGEREVGEVLDVFDDEVKDE